MVDSLETDHHGLEGCWKQTLIWMYVSTGLDAAIRVLHPGIILCVCPANGRGRYNVTSSLIALAHAQNDPWHLMASPGIPRPITADYSFYEQKPKLFWPIQQFKFANFSINLDNLAGICCVIKQRFNGSVQERCNSIANALELCLSCTNPLTCSIYLKKVGLLDW